MVIVQGLGYPDAQEDTRPDPLSEGRGIEGLSFHENGCFSRNCC